MGDLVSRRLLGACSTGFAREEHRPLRQAWLARVENWDELVLDAEKNGIGPLAALHLAGLDALPKAARRGLLGLAARHTRATEVRTRLLEQACAALDAAGLRYLLLKGAALAYLVYPRPELRAMRDVDLLFAERDIPRAESVLAAAGFTDRLPARPGLHEVVTLRRESGGFSVAIELHRRLGLLTLPLYAAAERQTLEALWDDSQPVAIGSSTARAPGRVDLLRYVFRHGFSLQLDEDRLRYVAIADAVTAMEAWVHALDWRQLRALDPVAVRGLAMLHHVLPLSAAVLDALGYEPRRAPVGIGDQYWGWPRVRRPPSGSAAKWLIATLFPSEWWLRTRHGSGAGALGLGAAWRDHVCELAATGFRVCTGAERPTR